MDKLAIYIHWPYCARICPYCDFNVYKHKEPETTGTDLVETICEDLSYWRNWGGPRDVSSVHFGGGTPSLLRSAQIMRIITHIRTLWALTEDCEFAIEANPNDANPLRWQGYLDAGITRMSLGVQSFNGPALELLGRDHGAKSGRAALDLAQKIFPRVSADLIYGWRGQTEDILRRDLETLLTSEIGHISAYQLTIEDSTAFGRAALRGDVKAVNDDISAQFYDQVKSTLELAGFAHYEVSNFARRGQRSAHNLAYWQGRDYAGVGPGAHGRFTISGKKYATISALRPQDYSARIRANGNGIAQMAPLSAQEHGEEYVLMGLRIEDGISLSKYKAITGAALNADALETLIEDELLYQDGDRLRASDHGRLVLNRVTQILLAG